MGIVQRQTIKASALIYFGVVFGFLYQVVLFPKYLSLEQIGLVSVLLAASNILAAFVQFGMPNTIVRFRPKMVEAGSENRFVAFSMLVPLLIFLILFVVLFGLSDWIIEKFYSDVELIGQYKFMVPVFTFLLAYFGVWAAQSRSLLRIVVPNMLDKVVNRILFVILTLLLGYSIIDFNAFLSGYVLVYFLILLAILIYVNKLRRIKFDASEPKIPSLIKREMLTYGGFSFLTIIGNQVVENIDVMMIPAFFEENGLDMAGIYKTTFYMGAVIMVPLNSMGQIASPIYADAWHKNDLEKIEGLYKRSAINLSIIGTLLFLGIYVNIDNIFNIMPNGEKFEIAKNVILLVALSRIVSMYLGTNSQLIANSKYYHVNLISLLILAALTVGTNLIFIPMWGITGAAFASVLSLVVFNLIKFFFILIKYKMTPFTNKTLIVLVLGGFLIGLNYVLPTVDNVFIDIIYRSLVISILFGTLIYILKVSEDVNKIVDNKLLRK